MALSSIILKLGKYCPGPGLDFGPGPGRMDLRIPIEPLNKGVKFKLEGLESKWTAKTTETEGSCIKLNGPKG